MNKSSKIGIPTALCIVVANMVGTGVFTSLGYQLQGVTNTCAILLLWGLGGVIAISGAFSYAEVGSWIKKSGGEFSFLSSIYSPLLGYLSGWISLTVGFSAPIALAAIAFTTYLSVGHWYAQVIAILLILMVTWIHTKNLRMSSIFQNISTLFKIVLILTIIGIGLYLPAAEDNAITAANGLYKEVFSASFAVSLIYVSYSYSGWNAASYIIEELKMPKKTLPIALVGGSVLVMLMYTALQYVFLRHVPLQELVGVLDVGNVAVGKMLGESYVRVFSITISLLLVSGMSAMVWVGARVTSSMAREYSLWKFFRTTADKIPVRALWLQSFISILMVVTGTFEQILVYCGILLTLSSSLVVLGVIIVRVKRSAPEERYRSPLFPVFQIVFLTISLWMIVFSIQNYFIESLIGLLNVGLGAMTYLLNKHVFCK